MKLDHIKPKELEIEGEKIQVKDWTDLCIRLVTWLEEQNHLKKDHIPIFNHANRDKYFVNSEKKHMNPSKDGKWNRAGSFYIDTKYASDVHVKNLRAMLDAIGKNDLKIRIGPFIRRT